MGHMVVVGEPTSSRTVVVLVKFSSTSEDWAVSKYVGHRWANAGAIRLSKGVGMAKCTECGAAVADDLKFCGYCGAKINVISEHMGTRILGNTEAIMSALSQVTAVDRYSVIGTIRSGKRAGYAVLANKKEGSLLVSDGEAIVEAADFVRGAFERGEIEWDPSYTHACPACLTRYHVTLQVAAPQGRDEREAVSSTSGRPFRFVLEGKDSCPVCSMNRLLGTLESGMESRLRDGRQTVESRLNELGELEVSIEDARESIEGYRASLGLLSRQSKSLCDTEIGEAYQLIESCRSEAKRLKTEWNAYAHKLPDEMRALKERLESKRDAFESSPPPPCDTLEEWHAYCNGLLSRDLREEASCVAGPEAVGRVCAEIQRTWPDSVRVGKSMRPVPHSISVRNDTRISPEAAADAFFNRE